jgi:hypothetical protein
VSKRKGRSDSDSVLSNQTSTRPPWLAPLRARARDAAGGRGRAEPRRDQYLEREGGKGARALIEGAREGLSAKRCRFCVRATT